MHEATKSPLTREALDRIAALSRIEETIGGRPPDQRLSVRKQPDQRLSVRKQPAAPLIADMREWLEATRFRISGRSDLAGAIRYAYRVGRR